MAVDPITQYHAHPQRCCAVWANSAGGWLQNTSQARIPKWIQKCLCGNQLWIDCVRVTLSILLTHWNCEAWSYRFVQKSYRSNQMKQCCTQWPVIFSVTNLEMLLSPFITRCLKLACGFFFFFVSVSCAHVTDVEDACLCFKGFGWEREIWWDRVLPADLTADVCDDSSGPPQSLTTCLHICPYWSRL